MDGSTLGEGSGGSGDPTKAPTPTDRPKDEPAGKQNITEAELLKSAIEQFRFVTTMFWQQAGFFLLIQGWLATVLFQSFVKGEETPGPSLILSVLGLGLATFWTWVAWKRFEIIEYWRRKVVHLDGSVDPHYLLYAQLDEEPDRRPTAVARFLPPTLAALWSILLIVSACRLLTRK
jgi:hypothetical protein